MLQARMAEERILSPVSWTSSYRSITSLWMPAVCNSP